MVGAVGWWWWWWFGPSLPLVDGGGSVRGWLLMAICGGCWWMVGCSSPFIGGGVTSLPFVVGAGGWWWCSCRHVGGAGRSLSFVGGAAGRSKLVVHVVISHCCSLLSVTVHHSSVSSSSGVVSFCMVTWLLMCWRAFPLGRGNKVGS